MANNYTLFSEVIKCGSEDEAQWLEDAIKTAIDTDDGESSPCCETLREGTELSIYSEENCDLEVLAQILGEYQDKFKDPKAITVTWAHTCDKPRAGEFGGGAFCVKNGKATWLDAHDWAFKEAQK
jgi:hypothetical protein